MKLRGRGPNRTFRRAWGERRKLDWVLTDGMGGRGLAGADAEIRTRGVWGLAAPIANHILFALRCLACRAGVGPETDDRGL